MDALLVVDMQVGVFTSSSRYEPDSLVERINLLSEHFRRTEGKVIFIQHDGTKENYLFPESDDWKIIPSLVVLQGDIRITKIANDSFYKTNLENLLRTNGINRIYICGCATDFCVNATIHSALVKDFDVTVVEDSHTTADRPGFSAKDLIEFHNWLWGNLTPTEGKITLKKSQEILTVGR